MPIRIAPAMMLARTATLRRARRGRPSVTARKVGARPIGSTTTNNVTSADMVKSSGIRDLHVPSRWGQGRSVAERVDRNGGFRASHAAQPPTSRPQTASATCSTAPADRRTRNKNIENINGKSYLHGKPIKVAEERPIGYENHDRFAQDSYKLGRRQRSPAGRRRPLRYSPGFHHRGDEEELPRLRHERDRGARAAGCARRAQAGASAHPLLDARERLRVEQAVSQIRARRRRRDRQISSARRPVDLRRAGAHGAGFLHAPAADRRAGQFRLGRRRCAGGDALHRSAARPRGRLAGRRSRQGHRRLPAQLRQFRTRAGGAAGALSQPPGQRRRRHRRRHGDQHPAAQSRRGDRRLRGADRQSRRSRSRI